MSPRSGQNQFCVGEAQGLSLFPASVEKQQNGLCMRREPQSTPTKPHPKFQPRLRFHSCPGGSAENTQARRSHLLPSLAPQPRISTTHSPAGGGHTVRARLNMAVTTHSFNMPHLGSHAELQKKPCQGKVRLCEATQMTLECSSQSR